MALLVSVAIVFILLLLNEAWWRHSRIHNEISRKFVHISVGTFVAFWPFFMSWRDIEILSIAFLAGNAISKYQNIFKAIHSVQRPTEGEIFFALAVGVIALIAHDKWIYMTALLQMSLADGLAAVAGVSYGRKHRYLVFGQTKSVLGTSVFAIVSIATLLIYNMYGPAPLGAIPTVGLAAAATLIENLAVMGLDNLLVPLLIASALRLMS